MHPLLAEPGDLPVSAIDARSSPRGALLSHSMGAPMPAPRLPRSGPLWGTRDATGDAHPGGAVAPHRERSEAGWQDSSFPGSRARATRSTDPA